MSEQIPLPKAQSFGSVLMNVFSSPADAFQDLAGSESKPTNWLFPLIAFILLASVSTYTIFSNESLKTQALEVQSRAIDKRVSEGKMTQEQADQARDRMDKMGGMFVAIGIVTSVIFLCIMMFGAPLFLWLGDKLLLKSPVGYVKHLEMFGISSWIGILGGIVTLFMIVGLNTMYATPSAALAVYTSFDPMNTTDKILSALNIFTIWQTAVVGIGLGKFANKPAATGMGLAFGLWILWSAIQIFLLGLAQ
jgi:hypothetical protein